MMAVRFLGIALTFACFGPLLTETLPDPGGSFSETVHREADLAPGTPAARLDPRALGRGERETLELATELAADRASLARGLLQDSEDKGFDWTSLTFILVVVAAGAALIIIDP